jgi:chromosome segregation ATPase
MTEAIIITLITGFISIISILIKYRLDTNKNTREIKNLVEEISANDKRQNENITGLNNRIDYLNGDIKKIDATLNRFITDEQLINKINEKYIDMQYDLSKVIIKDIQNEEHNGDLVSAKQKIDDFKETVEGFYGN